MVNPICGSSFLLKFVQNVKLFPGIHASTFHCPRQNVRGVVHFPVFIPYVQATFCIFWVIIAVSDVEIMFLFISLLNVSQFVLFILRFTGYIYIYMYHSLCIYPYLPLE
jgi:hypothetical protein